MLADCEIASLKSDTVFLLGLPQYFPEFTELLKTQLLTILLYSGVEGSLHNSQMHLSNAKF